VHGDPQVPLVLLSIVSFLSKRHLDFRVFPKKPRFSCKSNLLGLIKFIENVSNIYISK